MAFEFIYYLFNKIGRKSRSAINSRKSTCEDLETTFSKTNLSVAIKNINYIKSVQKC